MSKAPKAPKAPKVNPAPTGPRRTGIMAMLFGSIAVEAAIVPRGAPSVTTYVPPAGTVARNGRGGTGPNSISSNGDGTYTVLTGPAGAVGITGSLNRVTKAVSPAQGSAGWYWYCPGPAGPMARVAEHGAFTNGVCAPNTARNLNRAEVSKAAAKGNGNPKP